MKVFFISFISIFLFVGCSSKVVVFENESILDKTFKKEKYDRDILFCEVNSYNQVPMTSTQPYRSNSGKFKATDLSGNRYEGTYTEQGGFASGFAAGAAIGLQKEQDNLRQKLIEGCMIRRGWNINIKEEFALIPKTINELKNSNENQGVDVDKSNKNVHPNINNIIAYNESRTAFFIKNQKYVCAGSGMFENGKLYHREELDLNNKIEFIVDDGNVLSVPSGMKLYFQQESKGSSYYCNEEISFLLNVQSEDVKYLIVNTSNNLSATDIVYSCIEAHKKFVAD